MKNYSVRGTLYDVSKVNNISDRFRKREFVIAIEEKGRDQNWVNYIKLQLENKDVLMIDKYKIGQEIEVSFDIKGNKAEKMGESLYFTHLKAWKIEAVNPIEDSQPAYNGGSISDPSLLDPEPDDPPF